MAKSPGTTNAPYHIHPVCYTRLLNHTWKNWMELLMGPRSYYPLIFLLLFIGRFLLLFKETCCSTRGSSQFSLSLQGAIDATVPEATVKVTDPDSPVPSITLSVFNLASPAVQLVTEMMIACGEAVAAFGEQKNISLPYRGQTPQEVPKDELDALPEGPCRAFASRRYLGRADMSFVKPIQHAALGVPGYVQFTSPIRRYSDLVAHYQVSECPVFDTLPLVSPFNWLFLPKNLLISVVMLENLHFKWMKASDKRIMLIEIRLNFKEKSGM